MNAALLFLNLLEQVVADPKGTGKNAYIKGYRLGGKTGTSEKGRNNNKRIASFVGFAPADDPQLICLIMLDEPQVANKYGGTIAAPVVGSILEESLEYMGVERQYTQEETQSISVTVPDLREMTVAEAKASDDYARIAPDVSFMIPDANRELECCRSPAQRCERCGRLAPAVGPT